MKIPAIFVGHGSPMTALDDNKYRQSWQTLGEKLEKPKSILVISAHWYINETAVSTLFQPKQIFDFYGFPEELYSLQYNPVGSPELAAEVIKMLTPIVEVKINNEWGIDHGAWVPLNSLFPGAKVPVVQLSIDYSLSPERHYQIGEALRPLREQGIMIIGSGDIVHNLGLIEDKEDATPFPWAQDFENKVLKSIESGEHEPLINYSHLGVDSKLAIPTPEHYLPLLYILALQEKDKKVTYFAKGIAHGSISMTSFIV
ncbi:MAG: 4,5-DOPA dioxygenase extradiol [Patescibacteria group bacterium]